VQQADTVGRDATGVDIGLALNKSIRVSNVPVQRLLQQLDDENVPVEYNIFESTPAHELAVF
jgi:hypothetical protein